MSVPGRATDDIAQFRCRVAEHTDGELVMLFTARDGREEPLARDEPLIAFLPDPLFAVPLGGRAQVRDWLGKVLKMEDWKSFCTHYGSSTVSLDFSKMHFPWYGSAAALPTASLGHVLRSLVLFPQLQELKLSNLCGSGAGMWPLQIAGYMNEFNIQQLDVSGNDIRHEGAAMLALSLEQPDR